MNRDFALLQRARAGDLHAFEQVIARHLPRLHRFTTHLCEDAAQAEALLFESVLAAWHDLGSLGDRPLGTWLMERCAATAVHRLEVREGRAATPPSDLGPVGANECAPTGAPIRRAIRRGVRRLPIEHRVVFLLCDVDELSQHEVGRVLGRPTAQIRRMLHEARVAMVELIDQDLSGDGRSRG